MTDSNDAPSMTPRADIVVYGDAGTTEADRIERLFAAAGVVAHVTPAEQHQPNDPWMVLVSIPVRLLYSYLATLPDDTSTAAGQVADLVQNLAHSPTKSIPGLVLVQDTETGIEIVVPPHLPEEAFRSLAGVDLIAYTFGPLHYDMETARWKSILDE